MDLFRSLTLDRPFDCNLNQFTTPETPSPTLDNAYGNSQPQHWSHVSSNDPEGEIRYQQQRALQLPTDHLLDLSPVHLSYSATNPTATMNPSPASKGLSCSQSLPPSLANLPTKIDMNPEVASTDGPYFQLIYNALLFAPEHKLPVQGIYRWFERNTAKAKDPNSKGWQNSIRYNLSQNPAFESVKEETIPGKRPVKYWRLTNEAVKSGIRSTIRYQMNKGLQWRGRVSKNKSLQKPHQKVVSPSIVAHDNGCSRDRSSVTHLWERNRFYGGADGMLPCHYRIWGHQWHMD
ncbi:hypothetical protein BJX70DRAFT_401435 [Aspergillus crustosus]